MKRSTATLCAAALATSVFGSVNAFAADRAQTTESEVVSVSEYNKRIAKGEVCLINAILIEADEQPQVLTQCTHGCW